jgi:hypothetical protein
MEKTIQLSGLLLAFKMLNVLSGGRLEMMVGESVHFNWGNWDIVVDQEFIKMARNGNRREQKGVGAVYPSGQLVCGVVETQDIFSIDSRDSLAAVGHKSMYVLGDLIKFLVPVLF